MKYLHFARDNFYENIEVEEAARILAERLKKKSEDLNSAKELLGWLRNRQRTN